MSTRIEPPILLSRLMTFVFSAAVIVVVALGFTLYKMFPLNRPQVFFLTTTPRSDLEIKLTQMPPRDEYFDAYTRAFIREYVRARNEIIPNQKVMRRKWNNDENGVVRALSTPDVYNQFTQTNMWNALMNNVPDFEFSCPVEFQTSPIEKRTANTYAVSFRYFCTNNDGQVRKKDYTIRLTLDFDGDLNRDGAKTIRWADRLDNPLGIRVSKYEIESGNGDPLDTGYME